MKGVLAFLLEVHITKLLVAPGLIDLLVSFVFRECVESNREAVLCFEQIFGIVEQFARMAFALK